MSSGRDWSFVVAAIGGANDSDARAALAESLLREFPDREGLPDDDALGPHARVNPALGLGLTESIVGIVIFLTGCVAKRLVDDVYDLKMRAHVRKLLGERAKPTESSRRYEHGFVLTLWHAERGRGVVVAAIGSSPAGLLESEALMGAVHLQAEQDLAAAPADRPIALYPIVDGALQPPQYFASLAEAHELIAAIPKNPRALSALKSGQDIDSSVP